MSKPQTVSRRASAHALKTHANDVYDTARSADAWAAGYRAGMRDVRRLITPYDYGGSLGLAVVAKFVNDTERLK